MRTALWILGGLVTAVLILSSFFHFSTQETAHPDVTLRAGTLRKQELELRKTVEVSGNMHAPSLPFERPTVLESSDWLYFDGVRGKIEAADIVFTPWRACPNPVWWQKDMRGFVEVGEDQVRIELYMPYYDNGNPPPTRYVPWEHNGVYRLLRSSEPAVPPDESKCGV